jgi:uncharacterized OB-fold protein
LSSATRPYLLDFYPLEDEKYTRIAPFFIHLRAGRLTTTKCERDGSVHWPPRVACPNCHGTQLAWVDLPRSGRLYAFSALYLGLPLGMEQDAGAVVGLVELGDTHIKIFSRITGRKYEEIHIGDAVELETFDIDDGRVFYRFKFKV